MSTAVVTKKSASGISLKALAQMAVAKVPKDTADVAAGSLGGQTVNIKAYTNRKGDVVPAEVWTLLGSVPFTDEEGEQGIYTVYAAGAYRGTPMVAYGIAGTWAGHAKKASAKAFLLLLSVAPQLRQALGIV